MVTRFSCGVRGTHFFNLMCCVFLFFLFFFFFLFCLRFLCLMPTVDCSSGLSILVFLWVSLMFISI